MNAQMFDDLKTVFSIISDVKHIRCVLLCGEGKAFCSGLDVGEFAVTVQRTLSDKSCEGRMREDLFHMIKGMQNAINVVETCPVPVIAVIQGVCIGAAVDLIAACDMRYCSDDASFAIKEVDLGIVADLGVLQRYSKILSGGKLRELAFTANSVNGQEAERTKLVDKCLPSREALIQHALSIAETISEKSDLVSRHISFFV
mmetsp:Transcript_33298/g.56115  ORF Transcript_33298/g.56115 Transcript_33298/m.56115 type:complete len:201 (-) Transcript_33298:763-1365(-)